MEHSSGQAAYESACNIDGILAVSYDSSDWIESKERSPLDGSIVHTLTHAEARDFDVDSMEYPLAITVAVDYDYADASMQKGNMS